MKSDPPHHDPRWEPLAFEPGTRVMFLGHPFEGWDKLAGVVGIVQDEDPYSCDARFPRRSAYITIRAENEYNHRYFLTAAWCVPYDGPAYSSCYTCGQRHERGTPHLPERRGEGVLQTPRERQDRFQEWFGVTSPPEHARLVEHTERTRAQAHQY